MTFSLGAAEKSTFLFQLLICGEVGEGNIELGALHIHIDTNEPLFLRQLHTCFDGIVKKIADDAAQINLRGFQLDGNMGIRNHRNTLGLCQRDF